MANVKEPGSAETMPMDNLDVLDQVYLHGHKEGNDADQRDMYRMGKSQQMKRNFKQITIFGFSMILVATWETVFAAAGIGLANGGSAGFIYMYIVVWIGFLCIYTSMAEMGSMAPTSGGQYHWVSEFAPRKYQKILSYIVGWLCVLGWQTSVCSAAYFAATEIQGLVVLNHPNYVFERWHGTLLLIALVILAAVFNIFLAARLPLIEGLILILHLCGFFCIIVPLWLLSPLAPAEQVFTQFQNGGWDTVGTSCMVGILAPILTMLGADSVAHMSEEIKDAAYALPRSMLWSCLINGALGLAMVITVCFCIGDVEQVLTTPTGYVFIQMFYNSTGSYAATNAMCSIVIIVAFFATITIMASASRQLFAFARDNGLPFSAWLSYIPSGWDLPLNAIYVSVIVAVILSLIIIGSTAAFNSITSLGAVALLLSYIVSTSCLFWRKLFNKPLLPNRFNLGIFGLIISGLSIAYLIVMFIFAFFPAVPLPALTVVSMNWSALIFGVVCIWSALYYMIYAHKTYVGPVMYVRRLD